MNSPTRELLDDLLTERDASFDERLIAGTLGAVRRRRRQRETGRVAAAAVVVIALLVWWVRTPTGNAPSVAVISVPASVPDYLVRTRPLSAGERVATQPGALAVVPSRADESLIVKTVPSPDLYQLLTDEELQQFLAGHDAVIVRQPGSRALLILDGKPVVERPDVN